MAVVADPRRLRARLEPAPSPDPPPDTRLAGVLVPLVSPVSRGAVDGTSVVFTRRTEHLPRHPGEISFPGGLSHEEDPDLRATALRESREELGLDPSAVEVLGALPPVNTFVSAILIVPFIGVLGRRPAFRPNAAEIAEVLEFPLVDLDAAEARVELPRDGRVYRGYAYEMPNARIWGATARILHDLLEIARSESARGGRG
jgi:8-oxo-dGTP pyrophosphatase MutT (NUDIX family)